ncbi:hypothetical protein [Bradyrhizobium sp. 187]|uniref:alpha/beta hydrolase family protein n=1 Tax=Bradyrhizobium sp. 187 TaxID=2782655 RepID=UPI001FFEFE53|nr:hypothetical protein [Bradyrhizobium sp. 187]UPJ76882.1 hypothetical protein IVB19_39085 [Bradyrhizobium sp. 187]
MKRAAWPGMLADLASTRTGAAAFLENIPISALDEAAVSRNWAARWRAIGDAHFLRGDLKSEKGAIDEAREAWLCALTALEVARRLLEEEDPQGGQVSSKIELGVQRLGSALQQRIERVQITSCWNQSEAPAYYLPGFLESSGGRPSYLSLCSPAVICVSREQEAAAILLGRVLPVAVGRDISILVVSHEDVSNQPAAASKFLLSSCLDFLSVQPNVDPTRIGVYGEGLSAVLATDFAAADTRVAAAVCDGGLWNWARMRASVGWLTRAAEAPNEQVASARRSQQVRQMKCPVLVVAGGRGIVSVSEAMRLQNDCADAQVDVLTMPQTSNSHMGEIENFLAFDDRIFRWLEHKLVKRLAPIRADGQSSACTNAAMSRAGD